MQLHDLVSRISSLADPTRLRLLAVLHQGSFSVSELSRCTSLSQPRVSHHLGILLRSQLVRVKREGVRAFYSREHRGPLAPVVERVLQLLEDPQVAADVERACRCLDARRHERREFFSSLAQTWPRDLERWIHLEGYRDLVLRLMPQVEVLADVGCGSGWLLPHLSSRAARIVGVDHAPEVLSKAKAAARGSDACCEFRLGEAEHLPLRDGEVEAVFMGLVLHHLPDPLRALEEASRVCRPGGWVVVVEPLAHGVQEAREELGSLWMGFQVQELADWLSQAGFFVDRVEQVNPAYGLPLVGLRGRLGPDGPKPHGGERSTYGLQDR